VGALIRPRTPRPRSQQPKRKDIAVTFRGCSTDEAGTRDGNRRSTPDRDGAVRGARTPPTERRSGGGSFFLGDETLKSDWPFGQATLVRPNRLRQQAPSDTAPVRRGTGRRLLFSDGPFLGARGSRLPCRRPLVWDDWPGTARTKSGEGRAPRFATRGSPTKNTLLPRLSSGKMG
jgi:hypothetical protein